MKIWEAYVKLVDDDVWVFIVEYFPYIALLVVIVLLLIIAIAVVLEG